MKRVIKRTAAVVLAITVLCGTVAGSYQNAQAGDFSAGALQYASDFSFLEALFNASGLSLGLDMLLKTQKDIDKFKEENWDFGDLLDQPLTQKQIDEAQEKIEKLYYGATEAYKKTHGNGSKPTPTPMITEPPAPGVTPPVTVAPINPDDVTMPDDWATMKKNATDKGVLAMGAATAYCVKEAVKGWWDDIVNDNYTNNPLNNWKDETLYPNKQVDGYKRYAQSYNTTYDGKYAFYRQYYTTENTRGMLLYTNSYYGIMYSLLFDSSYKQVNSCCSQLVYINGQYSSSTNWFSAIIQDLPASYKPSPISYTSTIPVYSRLDLTEKDVDTPDKIKAIVEGSSTIGKSKNVLWPSIDTKDDYDNNNSLPSPSYPNLAVPSITLPTLDEIKDLWKQGSDDEENRPTYVTNFITNHTVQPTPEPEPTKKPEVNPNPGGGTDPDPNPTPSTTPAVNPDPGGGTDPDPNPDPNPNPDPDNPDPDNPDNPDPTPEEEASPYKADLREVFPFCIPFDLIHLLKVFEADAEAPVFEFPLDIELDNPWTGEKVVDYHHTFKLDMSDYEPVIKILRIFQVVFFIIALMLITRQQMIKG